MDTGGDDVQALVDAMAQVSFRTMALLTRIGAQHDLSLTQLRALGVLRDRRARIGTLADYLGLERSTLSGLIDRAEKRGLISRGPSPTDGRVVEVFLSPAGLALSEVITSQVASAMSPLLDRVGSADQRRLGELLEQVLGPRW